MGSGSGTPGPSCAPRPCSDGDWAPWRQTPKRVVLPRVLACVFPREGGGGGRCPLGRSGAAPGLRGCPRVPLLPSRGPGQGTASPLQHRPAVQRVGPTSSRTGRGQCPAPGAGRAGRAQPASIFWAVLRGAAAWRVRKRHGPPGKRARGSGVQPRKSRRWVCVRGRWALGSERGRPAPPVPGGRSRPGWGAWRGLWAPPAPGAEPLQGPSARRCPGSGPAPPGRGLRCGVGQVALQLAAQLRSCAGGRGAGEKCAPKGRSGRGSNRLGRCADSRTSPPPDCDSDPGSDPAET